MRSTIAFTLRRSNTPPSAAVASRSSHSRGAIRIMCGLSTVGRHAAGDGSFFVRLPEAEKTFTIRKYDDVIGWFSSNWPADLAWPDDVPRPEAAKNQTNILEEVGHG